MFLKQARHTLLVAATLALTGLGSCTKKESTPEPSLYDRVGKTDGITKIVDNLIANVAAEAATNNSVMLRTHKPLLDAVNGVGGQAPTDPDRLQRLRSNFINQLGEATGGPLTYTGKSMLAAHIGMNITANEFSVWHTQWDKALSATSLSAQDKAALTVIIDKMQADVVGH